MDPGNIAEIISAFANMGVTLSAGVAAYQGIKSLSAWRDETIGRRRLELVEDLIVDFHQARDIFGWIRSPLSFSTEASERPGRDLERDDARNLRDNYWITLKRLSDNAEFFAKLHKNRYRAIAMFGQEAAKPFEDVKKIHSEIRSSASILFQMTSDERRAERQKNRRERIEAIIWSDYDDEDQTSKRLDAIVEVIEKHIDCILSIGKL